jgi:hypothetical protein
MTKIAVTGLIASAASFVKMNVDAAVVAALVFDLADPQTADLAGAPAGTLQKANIKYFCVFKFPPLLEFATKDTFKFSIMF